MKRLLLAMILVLTAGCSSVTTSQPFKIKASTYLQGGFNATAKTVIIGEDGSSHVIRGHCSVPAAGLEVVIVRRRSFWSGSSITIETVKGK